MSIIKLFYIVTEWIIAISGTFIMYYGNSKLFNDKEYGKAIMLIVLIYLYDVAIIKFIEHISCLY